MSKSYGFLRLNDGCQIPAIAYGTGSVHKGTDATVYVRQAVEAGFLHIDTAEAYETEEQVGKVIRESGRPRSDFYITTKYLKGPDERQHLENSLSKLGVEYVDLYLIHTPGFVPELESTWRVFEKIKEDGLAKSIGVSNFKLRDMENLLKIAKVIPAVNQIELHPYNWFQLQPLLDLHAKYGIITEAYSGLTPITKKPGGPVDDVLRSISALLRGSPEQVLLSWLKKKGVVIVTTSYRKERLQQYLHVPSLPDLTDAEMIAIDEAGAMGAPAV